MELVEDEPPHDQELMTKHPAEKKGADEGLQLSQDPKRTHTTGNIGSFVGTNEYNSDYICGYHKPTNIGYIHRFGPGIDEYKGAV
jgi:hypothetical protein